MSDEDRKVIRERIEANNTCIINELPAEYFLGSFGEGARDVAELVADAFMLGKKGESAITVSKVEWATLAAYSYHDKKYSTCVERGRLTGHPMQLCGLQIKVRDWS